MERIEEKKLEQYDSSRLSHYVASTLTNMGNHISNAERDYTIALEHHLAALEHDPQSPVVFNNLGTTYMRLGKVDEAIANFDAAEKYSWDEDDKANFASSACFTSLYCPDSAHLQRAREWALKYAPVAEPKYNKIRRTGKKIRIGYLSADWNGHSVAWFMRPIIEGCQERRFENFIYSYQRHEDFFTRIFRSAIGTDHWRNVRWQKNSEVAETIAEDDIDILIDLSGHTKQHRLGVFGYRPAPVQVAYLGYPATTGLEQLEYRLTDKYTDSRVEQHRWTERLVFLKRQWCYSPFFDCPPVSPAPCKKNGHVTFGVFAFPAKISVEMVRLWARILRRSADAELVIKTQAADDRRWCRKIRHLFSSRYVDPDRIHLIGFMPVKLHLEPYREIDLFLDTWPYASCTMACESAWQGVPVLALRGDFHHGRLSAAINRHISGDDDDFYYKYTALAEDEYVRKACAFAADPGEIDRENMRARMAEHLCEREKFLQNYEDTLESLYRERKTV